MRSLDSHSNLTPEQHWCSPGISQCYAAADEGYSDSGNSPSSENSPKPSCRCHKSLSLPSELLAHALSLSDLLGLPIYNPINTDITVIFHFDTLERFVCIFSSYNYGSFLFKHLPISIYIIYPSFFLANFLFIPIYISIYLSICLSS